MRSIIGLCLAGAGIALLPASSLAQTTLRSLVEPIGQSYVQSGTTVGVGIAVINGTAPTRFFGYGWGVAPTSTTPGRRFRPDGLFQIGSVTKVFTTNLLGQAVHSGTVSLSDPLSGYSAQLGSLKPLTGQITLQQLADFTGGVADYAPLCGQSSVPGCLPNPRPPINQYTAADYATYFAGMAPKDFSKNPPVRASSLPAPYYYSDFGVGMLGLLLASRDAPLSNTDLRGWYRLVRQRIMAPLGMRDTFLRVPSAQAGRMVSGYVPAIARASVANGSVSAIGMTSTGGLYASAPGVRILGGGGQGAAASAVMSGPHVSAIQVTAGGSGYIAPAQVIFSDGGSSTEAEAEAVVRNGRVVAIVVRNGGAGYQQVPKVTITGGRTTSGRDATAVAHLVNGQIGYLTVVDGGAGYVPPLRVAIQPGGTMFNQIPIWAPAGALTTSLRDLSRFARAALLLRGNGNRLPAVLADGFAIAETAYACIGPDPDLSACPAGAMRSGLSWAVQPADTSNNIPSVVAKDGGLPGYSTYVALMPEAELAVVVMANSVSIGLPPSLTKTAPAAHIANNVLYALFAACQSAASCPR